MTKSDTLPPPPTDAKQQVDALVAALENTEYVEYQYSDKIAKHSDPRYIHSFAVFGSMAIEMASFAVEFNGKMGGPTPALDGQGRAWVELPGEGSMRVLTWMHDGAREKTYLTWIRANWIESSELTQSAEQIGDNMAEEALVGMSPLTGGVPGW